MFVDFQNGWPPPERWEAEPTPLPNPRRESIAAWIIGFNLVMLLVGPLAGVTLFDAIIAALRH